MRPLTPTPAEPDLLIPAIRAALAGGPAVVPFDPAAGAPPGLPDRVPDEVALVVRTSGSSGRPKAVALSAAALLASAAATERLLGAPGDWVLALPGHYIAGVQVIVRALAAGGSPIALPPGPFTPSAFAAAIRAAAEDRPVRSSVVPTQLHRIVGAAEQGDADVVAALARVDVLLVGGGRLAPALADRAAAAGVRVRRTYGASETAGGCVYDGVPLPGVDVRTVAGEVQLAGPVLAEGYLGDPDRTAAAFPVEGGRRWYRTGDAGEWDGGRLTISGRLDDVIVSGGEKVSLGLVEQAVQALPGLADAIVVRAPDPEWGEVPVVIASAPVDLAAVRAAVAERLGRAAAPRRMLVLPDPPLLASGKPDRVRIAALAAIGGPAAG